MKMHGQFFEARADAAELFQPADALLDNRTTAIRLSVELHTRIVPGLFVLLVRDHRLDPFILQPIPYTLDTVAFVARELLRLMPAAQSLSPAADAVRHRTPYD